MPRYIQYTLSVYDFNEITGAVTELKQARPEMVPSLAQYIFLHEATLALASHAASGAMGEEYDVLVYSADTSPGNPADLELVTMSDGGRDNTAYIQDAPM